jgi:dTDP-4-amino-4,6-dideoxygalactose transaminase
MMRIPFFSFSAMNADLGDAPEAAFRRFWEKEWYILGDEVLDFEIEYAHWSGAAHCVGVANGLDALILALKALNIGSGDEVIVPSNTYIATWLAVSHVGARPIPVEPDWTTCNLDPNRIEAAITPATRAILPVHLYGLACDMTSIMAIAERHGLWVIEDNAQAHGAMHAGIKTGAWGHVNATSFYPTKNLGALGDAGAITTNQERSAQSIRLLRNYGSEKKYYNQVIGYNSRLDELQAALLRLKLPFLSHWTKQRRQLAAAYLEGLKDVRDLILPPSNVEDEHVYHLFVVRTPRRDALATYLAEQGIGTMIHYPVPPHLQAAYHDLGYRKGAFPLAEQMADTCLSLPLYSGMHLERVGEVCEAIKRIMV